MSEKLTILTKRKESSTLTFYSDGTFNVKGRYSDTTSLWKISEDDKFLFKHDGMTEWRSTIHTEEDQEIVDELKAELFLRGLFVTENKN